MFWTSYLTGRLWGMVIFRTANQGSNFHLVVLTGRLKIPWASGNRQHLGPLVAWHFAVPDLHTSNFHTKWLNTFMIQYFTASFRVKFIKYIWFVLILEFGAVFLFLTFASAPLRWLVTMNFKANANLAYALDYQAPSLSAVQRMLLLSSPLIKSFTPMQFLFFLGRESYVQRQEAQYWACH